MNDFWTNIIRYPKFFITSLLGLILIIIKPFIKFLKTSKLSIFFNISILILIVSLYTILINILNL